jgi:hypothetical protein
VTRKLSVSCAFSCAASSDFVQEIPLTVVTLDMRRCWTIKEIIQHLIDAERILVIALRIARNDQTPPGF